MREGKNRVWEQRPQLGSEVWVWSDRPPEADDTLLKYAILSRFEELHSDICIQCLQAFTTKLKKTRSGSRKVVRQATMLAHWAQKVATAPCPIGSAAIGYTIPCEIVGAFLTNGLQWSGFLAPYSGSSDAAAR